MLITYFKKLATQKTLLNNNEYPMVEYTPMGCSEAEIEALEKNSMCVFLRSTENIFS